MITSYREKEDVESNVDHIDWRVPPEVLENEEIVVNAAAHLYQMGLRDRAIAWFDRYYESAGDTAGITSFAWCMPSGELVGLVTRQYSDFSILRLNPEFPDGPFDQPIAKITYFYRSNTPGRQVAEPTIYFGGRDEVMRLGAREEIKIGAIKTAEDIFQSAAVRQAWGRKEAANGVVFQEGRAWGLQNGQLVPFGEGEKLYELLKRVEPDPSFELSSFGEEVPPTTSEVQHHEVVYVKARS